MVRVRVRLGYTVARYCAVAVEFGTTLRSLFFVGTNFMELRKLN